MEKCTTHHCPVCGEVFECPYEVCGLNYELECLKCFFTAPVEEE